MVLHQSCARRGAPARRDVPRTPRGPRSRKFAHRFPFIPLLCCSIGLVSLVSLAACGRPPATGVNHTPSAPRAAATPTLIGGGGWRVYRDPRGAFTLQVPQDWTADAATGDWIAPGGPTPDYGTSLGNPPGVGSATITFGVDDHALVGSVGHAYGCAAVAQATTTVGGLPAKYLAVGHHEEWVVVSASTLYQLTWAWPGYVGDWPGILAQTTYPDPATWHADQELAHLVLSSFQPLPATPLTCP